MDARRRGWASGAAPIEIGVAAGITGYLAAVDGPTAEGIQLAANSLNASGGVDGHQLNVHVVDMASVAATGVTAVNQLLNQNNVSVIMTGSSSAGTAAEAPIVTARQVPLMVNTVLPPDPDAKWVFSVLPRIDHIVGAQLNFAATGLKANAIGLLYSQTPYGQQASALVSTNGPTLRLNVPLIMAPRRVGRWPRDARGRHTGRPGRQKDVRWRHRPQGCLEQRG